jgi:hypothetical protein
MEFKKLNEEQNRLEALKSKGELTDYGLEMLTELNQALQLRQCAVSTSVCVCKVCDKPFGDTLSLWEHFYHNHIKETN